ncbi:MAG: heme-binding domain-containing protein [Sulfurimonas sp.]|nr:heme-binding domain-containing protein [Sulfurimonas sp.]
MKAVKKIIHTTIFVPIILLAHGTNTHLEIEKKVSKQDIFIVEEQNIYKEINTQYMKNIKPIFEKKCFDCHGSVSNYPWYYNVPGVKQMMDYDIKEAKKHMDMSKDFPFISHETPLNDLTSLKDIAIKGSMPPLRYVLGHWNSSLAEDEKQVLKKWSEESISKLKRVNDE